ncbi:MAG: hypothetical protein WBC71_13570, partial [Salaquimonas sp.]
LDLAKKHSKERNQIIHGLSAYDTTGDEARVVLCPHPIAVQLDITNSKREFEAEELDVISDDFDHLRKLTIDLYFSCFVTNQSTELPVVERRNRNQ